MAKILYIFIACCLFYIATYSVQPRWSDDLDLDALEQRLLNQNIVKLVDMRSYLISNGITPSFSHEVYLAIMEDGLKAVFKPEKKLHRAYAEVAAYKASKLLELRLVAPTVIKSYKGLKGSLQFFVEFPKPTDDPDKLSKVSKKDIVNMRLFCFIFGKGGTRAANMLVCPDELKSHIIVIDNAGMYSYQYIEYGDFPFHYQGGAYKGGNAKDNFPFDKQKTIYKPTIKEIKSIFSRYTTTDKIKKIRKTSAKYGSLNYCIWKGSIWVKKIVRTGLNYTDIYYKSILKRYTKLDRDLLEKIWSDGLAGDKKRFSNLIELIIQRRDQVLQAAKNGTIIKD